MTALYHIVVIVDPLSETGQKWSSLLKWLANIPDTFIKIYMNPGQYKNVCDCLYSNLRVACSPVCYDHSCH